MSLNNNGDIQTDTGGIERGVLKERGTSSGASHIAYELAERSA